MNSRGRHLNSLVSCQLVYSPAYVKPIPHLRQMSNRRKNNLFSRKYSNCLRSARSEFGVFFAPPTEAVQVARKASGGTLSEGMDACNTQKRFCRVLFLMLLLHFNLWYLNERCIKESLEQDKNLASFPKSNQGNDNSFLGSRWILTDVERKKYQGSYSFRQHLTTYSCI